MKITIIRHGKVNMKWPKKCTSYDFDKACLEYDISNIEEIKSFPPIENISGKIYVSPLSRSLNTAKRLFKRTDFFEFSEITEVPLKSFKDTNTSYPLWIWNVVGRIQWLFNNKRQIESRLSTQKRANKVIDICEAESTDCVLVTHGFFIKTLLKVLKSRGYSVKGNTHLKVKNLQIIVAEK